jgi:hypothetical protein
MKEIHWGHGLPPWNGGRLKEKSMTPELTTVTMFLGLLILLYRPRFPGHKVDVHAATGSAAWSQAARVRAGLR